MKHRFSVPAVVLAMAASMNLLTAERINQVSATVNTVAAADDNPSVTGLRLDQIEDGYRFTWGLYPSLQLQSKGARSLFDLNYAFGLTRVDSDLDLDSESHTAGMGLQFESAKWTVSLREQFRKSPDFSAFNEFRGIVFTPDGVFFDYETVALRRDSFENSASLQVDRRLGPRSSLTFGVGHTLRDYDRDPRFARRLGDQQQFTGNLGWDRQLSARTTLNTGYQFSHFDFETGTYPDARSYGVNTGFSVQINPTVSARISVGPSYTEQVGGDLNYWGYNANANISKSFENQFVSAYYSRRSGASIGIGGLSRTQQLGFGFNQSLNRRISADFGFSLYKTQRVFANTVDLKGLRSSLVLNFELHRQLLFNVGASYSSQEEDSDFPELNLSGISDLDRRRFWVSLRYVLPDLWRF